MYILLYILYTNIFHQKYYILTIYGVMLSYLLMTHHLVTFDCVSFFKTCFLTRIFMFTGWTTQVVRK